MRVGDGEEIKEEESALNFCFCKGFSQIFKYELVLSLLNSHTSKVQNGPAFSQRE